MDGYQPLTPSLIGHPVEDNKLVLPYYFWRLVLAHRYRYDTSNVRRPNADKACHIITSITDKVTPVQAVRVVHDSMPFQCRFRPMTQWHADLLDCGYRAFIVPPPATKKDYFY